MCPLKLHSLAIKSLKQLIYNYATLIPWKYEEFVLKVGINININNITIANNKKIMDLYWSCILVLKWILIQMNGHIVYIVLVNHV